MVVKVELPVGKLGLTVAKRPPAVGAVRTDSPVAGQVVPGDVILALTLPGMGDVDTTSMDGQAVMDTLISFADREGRSLTVEKHGIYGVGVPPGPLGVQFLDGTCTVHAVKPTSPLGATVEGNTLLSVNGQPVTPTTRRTQRPASCSAAPSSLVPQNKELRVTSGFLVWEVSCLFGFKRAPFKLQLS